MENRNNHNEEMPKAQSMKSVDRNHMLLTYIGLACYLLSLVFDMLKLEGLWLISCLASIVLCTMGIYKTFKYRKASSKNMPTPKDGQ